jgi:hypothetical protein
MPKFIQGHKGSGQIQHYLSISKANLIAPRFLPYGLDSQNRPRFSVLFRLPFNMMLNPYDVPVEKLEKQEVRESKSGWRIHSLFGIVRYEKIVPSKWRPHAYGSGAVGAVNLMVVC